VVYHDDVDDKLGLLADERVRQAREAGYDPAGPVPVTYFFSSPGRRPDTAAAALKELGQRDVILVEESSGDGYWHIASFGELILEPSRISAAQQQMSDLAQEHDVAYDGWGITKGRDFPA
jgi:broad specificity phosphatase PhoE